MIDWVELIFEVRAFFHEVGKTYTRSRTGMKCRTRFYVRNMDVQYMRTTQSQPPQALFKVGTRRTERSPVKYKLISLLAEFKLTARSPFGRQNRRMIRLELWFCRTGLQ